MNTYIVLFLLLQIMAKSKGLKWKDFKRLGDVQSALGLTLEDALVLVKDLFHTEPYTKEEVCGILEVTPEELAQTTLSANTLNGNKILILPSMYV